MKVVLFIDILFWLIILLTVSLTQVTIANFDQYILFILREMFGDS